MGIEHFSKTAQTIFLGRSVGLEPMGDRVKKGGRQLFKKGRVAKARGRHPVGAHSCYLSFMLKISPKIFDSEGAPKLFISDE